LEDESSVLRLGSTCTALASTARSAALWRRFLMRFFDGELPPALAECTDPLSALRDQVICAQELTEVEHIQRRFQVPNLSFPGCREWMRGLDVRVAAVQVARGDRHARQGRPYYGCSGGAYVQTTLVFGSYVKSVMTNQTASGYGIEQEATRLVAWGSVRDQGEVRMAISGCDYGPLCDFKEAKLIELASLAGHAGLAKSLAADRERGKLEGRHRSATGGPDVNVSDTAKRQPDMLRIGLPRLLAGMYGGLFQLGENGTTIGTIYTLGCVADGTSIADFSAM